MKKWRPAGIFFLFFFLFLGTSPSEAVRIRVAQESKPGAGDFDRNILGYIDAYVEKGKTAEAFYAYENLARFSFNGPHPRLQAETSHVFFVVTREGLTLFIVHDKPNDADGGVAVMRIRIEGDPDGARILVFDDPNGEWDTYEAKPGGREFSTWHRWFDCCTDGIVLGTLEGPWKVFLEFPEKDAASGGLTILGLLHWKAFSADGTKVSMKLEKGRRVRLDPIGPLVHRNPIRHPVQTQFLSSFIPFGLERKSP